MAGHLLNITITANETLKNANVTILGSTYVMNVTNALYIQIVQKERYHSTLQPLILQETTLLQTRLGSSNVIMKVQC